MQFISHRSYAINHLQLRQLRLSAGITQSQLAARAGYSERLIRKAETSGSLLGSTIVDLIGALRSLGVDLEADDLFAEPIDIAKRFMEAFELHTARVLEHTSHLFSETFVFTCAGTPPNPLAGTFEGLEAFQRWIDVFYGIFTRAPEHSLRPRYSCEKNSVLVRYHEVVVVKEFTSPPIWVNLHFDIQHGRIHRIEDEYDTQIGIDFLSRVGKS